MSKNNGPWGNDSPWNEPENTASPGKVIDFANIKKPGGFDFKISWIIAAVALLWLATGFYQVQPNEQGVVLRNAASTSVLPKLIQPLTALLSATVKPAMPIRSRALPKATCSPATKTLSMST